MSFFKDFKNDLSQAVGNPDEQLNVESIVEESAVTDTVDSDISLTSDISLEDIENIQTETVVSDDILQAVTQAQIDLDGVSEIETAEVANDIAIEPAVDFSEPVMDAVPATEEVVMPTVETVEEITIPEVSEEITIEKEEDEKMSEIDNSFENEPATDDNAIITEGMKVTGDIISTGNMDVLGTIKGNVDIKGKLTITGNIEGNSKAAEIFADSAKITGNVTSSGSVKVGQSSVIVGDIIATSAVVAGAVKGNIDVHGPVILDTSAIVMGDIKSKSVQINNGAVIEGHCSQCYAEVSPTSFFNDIK